MGLTDSRLTTMWTAPIRSWFGVTISVLAVSMTAPLPVPAEPQAPSTLWSLQPLAPPSVPSGASHPIDAFIRQKLAERKLSPSSPADRRTLLRRLSYDLTGLPPTAEDCERFVENPELNPYEAEVDRLLSSPRYGEHWARHWLDVANYADTHGNDHDYARPNAWPYRDYVIRAFNADKPYPRFVQEQVAGDVLFPHDPEALVALGFVAAGPWDHTLMVTVREDTVDHQLAQYLDRDNMVSTVIGTFQSLTVHCARCHDHKFDPISQREYYSLQAVFAGVDRANRPFDPEPSLHQRRQRLLAEQRALRERDPHLLAQLRSPEIQSQVDAWERAWREREQAWSPLGIVSAVSTGGASLMRQTDGSWLVQGNRPERDTYILTARSRTAAIGAIRLEVLPDDRLPQRGPGRWDNGNFHLTEFRLFAAIPGLSTGAVALPFARARADFDEGPTISASEAIDGKNETFWGIHPRYGEPHEAVFELKEPQSFASNTTFTVLLENLTGAPGHGIGRFRVSTAPAGTDVRILPPLSPDLTAVLRVPLEQRTEAQRTTLALAVLTRDNERALAELPPAQQVYAIARDFPPDGPNFKPAPTPRPIHILARGEIQKPGETVGPGTLGCVPGMSAQLDIQNPQEESARRAALARWLASEHNVLTWRSIVNRVWAWHFGRGLVDTPQDFGRMGSLPTHPELLDWLAVWFRDEAHGSLKALHRLIVTSQTWQQTSQASQGSAIDADNRLLWRQNRLRLSGEALRDTALLVSGNLDLTMGGPPAVQFVSKGDATFMSGGNPAFLDYEHFDPEAPEARRRAVYRFLFRTVPDPLMDALDCPDGSTTTPVRGTSTTAQQAFALLNDGFLIRQCQRMSARLEAPGRTPTQLAEAGYRALLFRAPQPQESARLADYIQKHGFANACQLLLNCNEFLFLD